MANVLGKVHTINARETTFFNANRTYDRIITDIPSFANRWPGTQGEGEVVDNVNAVIHVMNNNMSADGTATLSMTGIAQEKFNAWFDSEHNTQWERVPESQWAMFRPYYMNKDNNQHLWGRRDDWTFVESFRKIGSDYTIDYAAWPGIQSVQEGGDDFDFPPDRSYIKYSAFRAPVHKGINSANEAQQWFQSQGIQYQELYNETHGVWTVGNWEFPGFGHMKGYVVMPSHSWTAKVHIPARWYPHGKFTQDIIAFANRQECANGLRYQKSVGGGNHRFTMLASWIVATHTNEGDNILDPFCGIGCVGAAALIWGRNFEGIEFNPSRSVIAENSMDKIMQFLNR